MLKKLKYNNRAAFSQWQRGYMYMIMFFVFTFCLDIMLLALQFLTTAHQINYVATKLSFQGGFIGQITGSAKYWSNEEIYTYINKSMVRFGIDGINYHWWLWDVKPGGGSTTVVATDGIGCNYGYKNRNSHYGAGEVASSYNTEKLIRIGFNHKYFFSFRVFHYNSSTHVYYLTHRYQNEYINGS